MSGSFSSNKDPGNISRQEPPAFMQHTPVDDNLELINFQIVIVNERLVMYEQCCNSLLHEGNSGLCNWLKREYVGYMAFGKLVIEKLSPHTITAHKL